MEGQIGILGGGFAGVATALALDNNDIGYKLYDQKPLLEEPNAGMLLWPSGVESLKKLGVFDNNDADVFQLKKYKLYDKLGNPLNTFDLSNYSEGIYSMSRKVLMEKLLNKLDNSKINLDHSYFKYVADFSKPVKVMFHNGTEENFDFVMAADGAMSVARLKLVKDGKPEYSNYTIWRGVCDFIPSFFEGDCIYDFIDYKKRFIAYIMPGNKLAWNMVSFESNKFLHQTGNRKRKLTNYLKNWKTELSSIILETEEESIIKSGAFLRPALKNWVPERIFRGGDANLLLSPLLGLGANFAFQEAVELAETIKKLGLNQFAFDEFEKWRNTKGTILQDISKRYVTVSQMSTLVALFAGNSTIVNRVRRVITEAALGQD